MRYLLTVMLLCLAASALAITPQSFNGTAPKLTTGRTLSITGPFTWTSPAFDGSGNVTAAATVTSQAGTGSTFMMDTDPIAQNSFTVNQPTVTVGQTAPLNLSLTSANWGPRSAVLQNTLLNTTNGLSRVDLKTFDGVHTGSDLYLLSGFNDTGHVAIGSTTDDGSNMLQVAGSGKFTGGFQTTGIGVGITPTANMLQIYGTSNKIRLTYPGVVDADIYADSVGFLRLDLPVKINSGTNTVYRCVGGTNDGAVNWKSTGPCPGGTNTASNLKID